MNWIKKGLIFSEEQAANYGLFIPQVPYALELTDRIRIFFGARKDGYNGAAIYFIDVDIKHPQKLLRVQTIPVLNNGKIGSFDQDGILPVCIMKNNDNIHMYYGGFSKVGSFPHTCMMGLGISTDNSETFEKYKPEPIFGLSENEPYLIGSADIKKTDDLFHMVYTSGTDWISIDNKLEISYTLKDAYSANGIDWEVTGNEVIPRDSDFEAFAKPSIFQLNNEFVMYFSKRKIVNYREKGESAYSIAAAMSSNLKIWERNDSLVGISPSETGWDSEMICYPNIIKINNRYLMFYNGNGFGKSGIGYAELEQ